MIYSEVVVGVEESDADIFEKIFFFCDVVERKTDEATLRWLSGY